MYQYFIKNLLDRLFAAILLLLLSLPMLFIAIAIKITSKGPVFFKQNRIGIYKKPFQIIKFRTMKTEAPQDVPTHQFTDPQKWITRIGAFLRKTSLDELPQLFNIVMGDMSFVGPRPALWNQEDLITEREKYNANNIKPGLTGWAQINGRNALDIATKAKLDGEYRNQISFFFDLKCIFETFKVMTKNT